MQSYNRDENKPPYDYREKNGLVLLRVSTEEQEKKYGFPSQLHSIREKLLEPLGIRIIDEEKYIIRDTYTGMKFRERPELKHILEMAERQEFDVLVMDTLDRLGRKGLQREIYRAELRSYGIRILTTEPGEHADDDSLMGEMIRLLHGFKAEQERNDIVRRTVNGKRERVKEGKLLPGRKPLYGYRWGDPEISKKTFYIYHPQERVVVERMFNMAKNGVSLRRIAKILTEEGIPTPEGKSEWHSSTVDRLLRHPFYMGEAAAFRSKGEERQGYIAMVLQQDEDQMKITKADVIPPIVTSELFEAVQERLSTNKRFSTRNNKHPHVALLRCGLIKCGHCGYPMSVSTRYYKNDQYVYAYYVCYRAKGAHDGRKHCDGGAIIHNKPDNAAWETALEIIRDPKKVDEKIEALRTPDPTARRRQQITNDLAVTRKRRNNLQNNLNAEMEKDDMDNDTVLSIKHRIKELSDIVKGYEEELNNEEITHKKWIKIEEKLNKLHQFCADMRERISDSNYEPSYQEKRDTLEFFGISAEVRGFKGNPEIEVFVKPPSIMPLLS